MIAWPHLHPPGNGGGQPKEKLMKTVTYVVKKRGEVTGCHYGGKQKVRNQLLERKWRRMKVLIPHVVAHLSEAITSLPLQYQIQSLSEPV